MAGYIKQLKDRLANKIFPVTLTNAVYDEDENRLDEMLSSLNMKFDQINSNLTDTWHSFDSYPTVKYRKFGKVVQIVNTSVSAHIGTVGHWSTVGTLPSGYRPKEAIYGPFFSRGSITTSIFVNSTGTVDLLSTNTDGSAYGSFTFIAD